MSIRLREHLNAVRDSRNLEMVPFAQVVLHSPERYLRWADCILLVFSITSRESFRAMEAYLAAWTHFRERLVRRASANLASLSIGKSRETLDIEYA